MARIYFRCMIVSTINGEASAAPSRQEQARAALAEPPHEDGGTSGAGLLHGLHGACAGHARSAGWADRQNARRRNTHRQAPHNRLVAMAAPSAIARNFAHITGG